MPGRDISVVDRRQEPDEEVGCIHTLVSVLAYIIFPTSLGHLQKKENGLDWNGPDAPSDG